MTAIRKAPETMNSKKRVLNTFAFEKTDRVPIDYCSNPTIHMAPRYLKEHFGGRLSFHGCISTAGALAYGTEEDVERTVRETLEIMMPGGGYHFAPTHMIQDNTPVENIVAMYQCAHRYGQY